MKKAVKLIENCITDGLHQINRTEEMFKWSLSGKDRLVTHQGPKLASGNHESLSTARCTNTETKSNLETKEN
jgi:hypothetical protein